MPGELAYWGFSDDSGDEGEEALPHELEAFRSRFLSWSRRQAWQTLSPVRRIYAISDLHLEHKANKAWLERLPAHETDALILAGDVGVGLPLLREAFGTLRRKFRHVFYVPGNHELWCAAGERDCLQKFFGVLEAANECGVHAAPCLLGDGGPAVVPLHAWWHTGFVGGPPPAHVKQQLEAMDAFCCWPSWVKPADPPASPLHPSHLFASLNEEAMAGATQSGRPIVTCSHFVPHPSLHRDDEHPLVPHVEGSLHLGRQVAELQPAVHVFGHTHHAVDQRIGATRYMQRPLGNPHERAGQMDEVRLALVWEEEEVTPPPARRVLRSAKSRKASVAARRLDGADPRQGECRD